MKIALLLVLGLSTPLFAADPSPVPSVAVKSAASPCMKNVDAVNAKIKPDKKGNYNSAKLMAWIQAVREGHPQKSPVSADGFKTEFDQVTDLGGFKQLYSKYSAYMCTPDYAVALMQVILNMERKELTKPAHATFKSFIGDETFWMPSLVSIGKRVDILRTGMRVGILAFSGNATMQLKNQDQAISASYMAQMETMHGYNGGGGTNQAADLLRVAKRDYTDSFKYQPDFYKWVAANL